MPPLAASVTEILGGCPGSGMLRREATIGGRDAEGTWHGRCTGHWQGTGPGLLVARVEVLVLNLYEEVAAATELDFRALRCDMADREIASTCDALQL